MNLYRLDYADNDEPVCDVLGTDYLGRKRAHADHTAEREADRTGRAVTVTRISGCGSMHVVRTVRPDYRPGHTTHPELAGIKA